jgi:hypothetical protein
MTATFSIRLPPWDDGRSSLGAQCAPAALGDSSSVKLGKVLF